MKGPKKKKKKETILNIIECNINPLVYLNLLKQK